MNKDKQRIAIAEFHGWTNIVPGNEVYFHMTGYTPRTKSSALVPNYPEDLNAMHEVEKLLDEDQRRQFAANLMDIVGIECLLEDMSYSDCYKLAHATAAQRAEALFRTINKWKESQ